MLTRFREIPAPVDPATPLAALLARRAELVSVIGKVSVEWGERAARGVVLQAEAEMGAITEALSARGVTPAELAILGGAA